jgi:hypothetical protein
MVTIHGTGPRAGAERIRNDPPDGARATPAFGAAAETVIDLGGGATHLVVGVNRRADIVVTEDVAGADDHGDGTNIRNTV